MLRAIRNVTDEHLLTALQIAAPAVLITLFSAFNSDSVRHTAETRNLKFRFSSKSLAKGDHLLAARIYDLLRQRYAVAVSCGLSFRLRSLARAVILNRGLKLTNQHIAAANPNKLLDRNVPPASEMIWFMSSLNPVLATPDPVSTTTSQELHDIAADLVQGAKNRVETIVQVRSDPHLCAQLTVQTANWFETVVGHHRRLARSWTNPPKQLWTGTGGNYLSRHLRAIVRSRGGTVTAYEHGGGGHIHNDLSAEVVNEHWLCDRFVADTAPKAKIYAKAISNATSLLENAPETISAQPGCAAFDWDQRQHTGEVHRVAYVTTAFVGETCYPIQPLLPDAIYADWQGRLIEILANLGMTVLVKQHPEGLAKGKPLIMSQHGDYLNGSFDDAISAADAFVFDYPATTTLWEAICTRKPIVFIDFGLADWNPIVRQHFERRCTIVRGTLDEWNRPSIESRDLSHALANQQFDSSFAEAYLTGQPQP